jgi:hypothetical protein
MIDAQIQSDLMDDGMVGDIYYGLNDGLVENFVRAERDNKLLSNAVNLRIRKGEDLEDAVAGAAKDLYGDVEVVQTPFAQLLLPTGEDAGPILGGLEASLPRIREAVATSLTLPQQPPASDGSRAVLDAATANYADNVLSQGFFRNARGGFVFIDPFTGGAVPDADGKPLVISVDEVLRTHPRKRIIFGSQPGFSNEAVEDNAARQDVFQ